ncbi:MAG TPA: serine hydrolase [Mucilaginibacter sp.]|nr:serine hydrolase [Mucilaginibacter sp.]
MKRLFFINILLIPATLFAQDSTVVKIDQLINAYVKLGKFNGTALVARHDQILLKNGYGFRNVDKQLPNDPQTIFQIASVTKTFTSATVLKLVQSRKLSLTDKLSNWYPTFPNADKITIENLLSHTSGIYDYVREDTVTHLNTEAKMMAFLAKKPLDFQPGTDWRYSNSGYSILGFIIAKETGESYYQAVRQAIFKPLEMNHSGFDFEHLSDAEKAIGYGNDQKTLATFADSSTVFAAGAIYSTVDDMYRWHQGLQSYQVVSKPLLDRATTPFKKNYGYGWIIDSVNHRKMVYHSGNINGFSSLFLRIPEDDICIVLLNNMEGTELETIARKVLDILYHLPYSIPKKKVAITLADEILERYTGTYEIADIHLTIEVSLQSHQLIAHAVNGPTFPLAPASRNLFFIEGSPAEIEFVINGSGKAEKLILNQNDQKKEGLKIK